MARAAPPWVEVDAQTQRAPASQPGALGVLEAGAGHGAEGRDAEVEVSPAGSGGGARSSGGMARSPTRLRSAAMERLLRLTARRRVGPVV